MKIEKLSETQIRCTLNKQDLSERELRISELAYGTEKAKNLFRDMMQQASYEFGFETEDLPLMIEAIPLSSESLVLVITKVEDPDELDTRFSKFSPDTEQSEWEEDYDTDENSYADEILNCYDRITDLLEQEPHHGQNASAYADASDSTGKQPDFVSLPEALGFVPETKKKAAAQPPHNLMKVFSFQSLQALQTLSEHLVYNYHGENTIYKDNLAGRYYLTAFKSDHTPEEFNKICNIIGEYGKPVRTMYASSSYYNEHFTVVIPDRGIQVLASI